jgi:hypothetical protein
MWLKIFLIDSLKKYLIIQSFIFKILLTISVSVIYLKRILKTNLSFLKQLK